HGVSLICAKGRRGRNPLVAWGVAEPQAQRAGIGPAAVRSGINNEAVVREGERGSQTVGSGSWAVTCVVVVSCTRQAFNNYRASSVCFYLFLLKQALRFISCEMPEPP